MFASSPAVQGCTRRIFDEIRCNPYSTHLPSALMKFYIGKIRCAYILI